MEWNTVNDMLKYKLVATVNDAKYVDVPSTDNSEIF
jgi:hypothetical protein